MKLIICGEIAHWLGCSERLNRLNHKILLGPVRDRVYSDFRSNRVGLLVHFDRRRRIYLVRQWLKLKVEAIQWYNLLLRNELLSWNLLNKDATSLRVYTLVSLCWHLLNVLEVHLEVVDRE